MAKEIEVVYEERVFKPLENLADLFLPVEEERKVKVKEIIEIVEGREKVMQ
jgi:predicted DNA-binding antitoxin AbrB/MazE fold protein